MALKKITLDKIFSSDQMKHLKDYKEEFDGLMGELNIMARISERFPTGFTINKITYLFDGLNKARKNIKKLNSEFYRKAGLQASYC